MSSQRLVGRDAHAYPGDYVLVRSGEYVSVERLLARLRNDRYEVGPEYADSNKRSTWNSYSEHVETVIVPQLVQHERVLAGSRELRDAPALDLRLKEALLWDEQVLQGRFDLSDCGGGAS